jgi:hypothetical protein
MVRHTGEDFIDEEGITITAMPSPQAIRVDSSKLDAPEADGLVADSDTTLGQ